MATLIKAFPTTTVSDGWWPPAAARPAAAADCPHLLWHDSAMRVAVCGRGQLGYAGAEYFFNFSNPNMARWWNSTLMLGPHAMASAGAAQTRCCGRVVDGIFVDDSTGLGSEHSLIARRCGMDAAAIADWNSRAHAA
jgi:hypothetical protein